ncbi:DUF2624 family protein [Bacillus sp. AFS041924]|uniref:DUF2624 family protein n=1 Tax=Bacillus sp. AFS041924 TaxID=2033503 RepID=UPI000BFC8EA6|nr:DUF2624 family protein [Bacillus sp. AFS041924]PGS55135.1 hypothetical protein COC46_04220 [Bacillus sp. AFS041924]
MNIIQTLVNKKVNNITPKDLLKLSQQYQVYITPDQANKVAAILNGKNYNIYDAEHKKQILAQIENVTSKATAQQIDTIFQKLT